MAATASLYPTTVASTAGTTWTNTTNATGSTAATFATWTNATSGGTGNIQLSGYAAQTAVNGGLQPVSIDSVAVTVASNVLSTTNISAETVQLYAVTTAIGAATALTRSTTSANVQTVTLSGANCPTWAQLADLRAQVNGTHAANTTSSTLNIDYVGVVVNFTRAKIGTLVSDFSSSPAFFSLNTGSPTVSGGVGTIPTISSYAWFGTATGYDATGSSTYVQIVPDGSSAAGTVPKAGSQEAGIQWGLDAANYVQMLISGGYWTGRITTASVNSDINLNSGTANWDPTVQGPWWRLRESGGTLFFDASLDGTNWTNYGSRAVALNLTAISLQLFSGYYSVEPTPLNTTVDNLNTTPVSTFIADPPLVVTRQSLNRASLY